MKVLLITTGSRGDVEPFVALARGLAGSHHAPTLAAPARFETLATTHGVEFIALDDSLFELQDDLARRGAFAAITGVPKARPAFRRFLLDVAHLARSQTDAIVYHPKTLLAPLVAEKLGVPALAAQLIPLYQPTAEFPAPVLAPQLPRRLNRASWRLVAAIEAPWRSTVREVHQELGLQTPLRSITQRIATDGALNAWSPQLLPGPEDWPTGAEPLGFWRLPPEKAHPPQTLVDFLAAGEAPVYVGFGSMVNRDPARWGSIITQALRSVRRRAVVTTGAGAIQMTATEDVLVLDAAPHQWLLPRVTAAVHHGGIGTVAAALAAGVPQVIRPFLGDQPFWARRVRDAQAGVVLERDTAAALAQAIRAAESLTAKPPALARAMAAEDGIAAAVARIERTTGYP